MRFHKKNPTASAVGVRQSGIEMWSTGSWKTNNQHTKEYKAACDNARKSLTLNYHHVDGHSGVFGNEYVDMLAKRACGVTT
ncbi:MAG: hypothetical protein J6N70_18995 [Oribacterium sp.]|nr:hypothetical protein [Oribacterium sp.]